MGRPRSAGLQASIFASINEVRSGQLISIGTFSNSGHSRPRSFPSRGPFSRYHTLLPTFHFRPPRIHQKRQYVHFPLQFLYHVVRFISYTLIRGEKGGPPPIYPPTPFCQYFHEYASLCHEFFTSVKCEDKRTF